MRSKAELKAKFKNYISKPMSKEGLQSKLKHLMSRPKRALHKAKDFYVKSLEDCASKVGYGSVVGCPAPAPQVSRLPRSFSVDYSKPNNEEKLMNFLEAMSKKRSMERWEESNMQQQEREEMMSRTMKDQFGGLKRCYSTTIGLARIDEDKPCCYFEDEAFYGRSRSYAPKRFCY